MGTMKRSPEPVTITLVANRLEIKANVHFEARALMLHPTYGVAYADLIEAGIRRKWSCDLSIDARLHQALHDFSNRDAAATRLPAEGEILHVVTKIYRDREGAALRLRLAKTAILPSHVGSPLWRRGWGVLRNPRLESMGLNWSRKHRGTMTMVPYDQAWQIESVAAHEFGHLLGIGDAYGAIYRYYDVVPDSENTLMRNNHAVSTRELAMVLDAQRTNKMQYFPKQFRWSQFKAGFKSDLNRLRSQMEDMKKS